MARGQEPPGKDDESISNNISSSMASSSVVYRHSFPPMETTLNRLVQGRFHRNFVQLNNWIEPYLL
jgi:hypothetical protein